jgi:hypothetical protein
MPGWVLVPVSYRLVHPFFPTFLCIYCRSYYTNGVWRDGKGLVMVLSISFCPRFLLFCWMEQRLGMVHLPGKARNAYLSILSDNFVLLTHPESLQVPYVLLAVSSIQRCTGRTQDSQSQCNHLSTL